MVARDLYAAPVVLIGRKDRGATCVGHQSPKAILGIDDTTSVRMVIARNVIVRIADDLPAVEVDAATVELSLTNYLSNATKYSDPEKSERWVEVSGELTFGGPPPSGEELVVRVRDNGLGIPLAARERLFEQFYRAHDETVTGVEGSGPGLSLVRETITALGGKRGPSFLRKADLSLRFRSHRDAKRTRLLRERSGRSAFSRPMDLRELDGPSSHRTGRYAGTMGIAARTPVCWCGQCDRIRRLHHP